MHVIVGCLVLFTTIITCLFLGICRPLKAYWDIGVEAVCLSDNVIENTVIAQGGNSILDILIQFQGLMSDNSPIGYH